MTTRTLWIVFAAASLLSTAVLFSGRTLPSVGDNTGYAPEQPIAFSHALHAGEMKISCLFCHAGAERSRHAGIPGPGSCMACHRFVTAPIADVRRAEADAAAAGVEAEMPVSPEIAKIWLSLGLNDRLERDESLAADGITWTRVHRLPDFVYFEHARHVNAGVACSDCHGPVETMSRVRQEKSLSMGFCLDCHRQVNANDDHGNDEPHATTDCAACHY